uniref:Uncharacterized protein n=1 Tax=Piliocolobus tephrosceles TaxID=591936 RepID=A0A8C9I1C1_9PRIM
MPFTSAKCRIFCHQNTMLPPQSLKKKKQQPLLEETPRPEKGCACAYLLARSRFWTVSSSSAQLCSICVAQSFMCAKADAGFVLCPAVTSARAEELPRLCFMSPLRALVIRT